MVITLFNPKNGEITGTVSSNDPAIIQLNKEKSHYVDGDFSKELYYISGGAPLLRPTISTTLTNNILSPVMEGSEIQIDGTSYGFTGDSRSVELEFPFPGEYIIHVIPPFPFLPLEFKYENNPQT